MTPAIAVKKISWNQNEQMKISTIEIKLDKLTYDVIKSIGKKIKAQTPKNFKLYPKKTPALVATAFPPLNFKKMEKVCPKMAQIPATSNK